MTPKENEGETLDLLWGARAISGFIGRTQRATFGMLENGQLPGKKVNGMWVVDRASLIDFFKESAS